MNDRSYEKEEQVRGFLSHLNPLQLYDAHLFGIDFETADIDRILDHIIELIAEVDDLKMMIDNNFENPEEKVLLPTGRETKTTIIRYYSQKAAVVELLMTNKNLVEMISIKMQKGITR